MNKFDKTKNIVQIIFLLCCVLTISYLVMKPLSSIGAYLVLICIFLGYLTYIYSKNMKKKSADYEKRNISSLQRRRRRLLDHDKGKVIEFPGTRENEQNGSSSEEKNK